MENILTRYAEYKGIELTDTNRPVLESYLNRAISVLETKLGYPLRSEQIVPLDLRGVSKHGCNCGTSDTGEDDLDPWPEIQGDIRAAKFDKRLPYQALDAFSTIYAVYIAKRTESRGGFIALKKLTNFQPVIRSTGFGNYIRGCQKDPCALTCGNTCGDCVSLLVDGVWMTVDNLPEELIYMIFDFSDWMEQGGYSNGGIASESVDGHSVSYGEWNKRGLTPFDDDANQAILANYIGAFGNTARHYIH